VTSIAIPDYYYWAKFLSLKVERDLDGVQFSTDGALLIAHSYSDPSFIVVFDVATGAVKSARIYSSGGFLNYNFLIKSMVISSGPSPMAYVLSNFKKPHYECTGQ
jgi:hypothetical protein